MKKIFIELCRWIIEYRKRLIYGALALMIFQISFLNFGGIWIGNEVFAQQNTQTQAQTVNEKINEWAETYSFLYNTIYILIYPVLILAWKLVDNSLVYWEVFWFDAVLWNLWNIVKNLANFTLWFIFLFYIFKYLLSQGDKKNDPKKIIIKSLIAWIWIQASWFIMASLIDLSTILTYSVWWLPISTLKEAWEKKNEYDPYMLKTLVRVDSKALDDRLIYLTNTKVWDSEPFYISECSTFAYGSGTSKHEIILAPKMIYYESTSWTYLPTDAKKCHQYGQVYYFSNLYTGGDSFGNCGTGCNNKQTAYKNELESAKNALKGTERAEIIKLIESATILEVWDAHQTGGAVWAIWTGVYESWRQVWLDIRNERTWTWWKTSRLSEVLDESYVWVFTALYSSLLNSKTKTDLIKESWQKAWLLNIVLNFGYVLAVWIPLIAMALVLMMRIGIIWIAIILSPFIVLATAFDEIGKKIFKSDFLKYFSIENLIPIIFSPVIVCLAVSLSSVLVTIISRINGEKIATENTEILWWLIELDIAWLGIPIANLIISIFGVAITWFLVWAAVTSTKLWEKVKWLQKLAEAAIGSMPIIPVPWKDGIGYMGVSTVFGWNGQTWLISQIGNNWKETFRKDSTNAINQLFDSKGAETEAQENAKKNRFDQYVSGLGSGNLGPDWVNSYTISLPNDVLGNNGVNTSFNQLESDDKKEAVIKKINDLDINIRKKLAWAVDIVIWDKTWIFKDKDYKYEEQKSNSSTSSGGEST